MTTENFSIAVVEWSQNDGVSSVIQQELKRQGYRVCGFRFDEPLQVDGVDLVLSFAPYGRLQQIPHQLDQCKNRPIFVHWNTENYPDPALPWPLIRSLSGIRSWIDRANDSPFWSRVAAPLLKQIDNRMIRFRLIGDYRHAMRHQQLDLLFESSQLYVDMHRQHGVPAHFVPWGTVPLWHDDLDLERDIDVLWMGKRRTKRRSAIIDEIDQALKARGLKMHIADNVVEPFIYSDQRTAMLNRAKITLNLESEVYDNALPYRYHVAAANGSLVVSEKLLDHYPVKPGVHYVSAEPEVIVDTILHYIENDAARQTIVDNAVELLTTELTLANALKQVVSAARNVRETQSVPMTWIESVPQPTV